MHKLCGRNVNIQSNSSTPLKRIFLPSNWVFTMGVWVVGGVNKVYPVCAANLIQFAIFQPRRTAVGFVHRLSNFKLTHFHSREK